MASIFCMFFSCFCLNVIEILPQYRIDFVISKQNLKSIKGRFYGYFLNSNSHEIRILPKAHAATSQMLALNLILTETY